MRYDVEDLDVGPLIEFYEPVVEPHRQPDAAVLCTPPGLMRSIKPESLQHTCPRGEVL